MSFMDKLMFWKKNDDFSNLGLDTKDPFKDNLGLGDNLGAGQNFGMGQQSQNLGLPTQSTPQSSFQQPPSQQPSYQQPQYQPSSYSNPQQDLAAKDMEIISSKLDALRVSIESINQRLANLESIARGEEVNRGKRYY